MHRLEIASTLRPIRGPARREYWRLAPCGTRSLERGSLTLFRGRALVCGIAGALAEPGQTPPRPGPGDDGRAASPRPRRGCVVGRRTDGARPPAVVDRRPVERGPATADQRGRPRGRRRQRRDLQPSGPAPRARAKGPHLPQPQRLGGGRSPVGGARGANARAPARNVRARGLGQPRPELVAGARSLRREAVGLCPGQRNVHLRLGDRRPAGRPARRARGGPRRARRVPGPAIRPQPEHHLHRRQEAAPGLSPAGAPRASAPRRALLPAALRA